MPWGACVSPNIFGVKIFFTTLPLILYRLGLGKGSPNSITPASGGENLRNYWV